MTKLLYYALTGSSSRRNSSKDAFRVRQPARRSAAPTEAPTQAVASHVGQVVSKPKATAVLRLARPYDFELGRVRKVAGDGRRGHKRSQKETAKMVRITPSQGLWQTSA